jgi:hypothetical protein
MLDSADQERICEVRRHTGWGAHAYANFLAQVLPGGPPAEPAKSSDGGTPWWPFALGGAILLVVGALLLMRRRVQSHS